MQSARWLATRSAAGLLSVLFVATASAESLDGWWISDGYGTLLEIDGDQIRGSEITAVSCLPSFSARRQSEAPKGAEAMFVMEQPPVKIVVKAGSAADHKFVLFEGAASSVGFRRIDRRPAICEKPAGNTPLDNFDIFWTTFDEHYPFFAMHGVKWRDVRDAYRPKITDETASDELFAIFKAMVEPLEDAHIGLQGTSLGQNFSCKRAGTRRLDSKTNQRIKEIVETNYVHGELATWCNGRVSYAVMPDAIGYLRITGFAGYAPQRDFDGWAKALEEALDMAFADADKLQGLIIDVRINHGGSDVLGVAVAARLATSDYLAFAKKARNDPADPTRFTARQEMPVTVSARPHFHGKVVLLTGGNTISAGETFTMALMGRTPAVVRVGENTQGVFSDVLGRRLPNGFRFGLPNEIFVTKDGQAFDGPGIRPHVPVAVFPPDDLEQGRDGCLEKGREILLSR
ncbi:MAG: S41 family peptidase [Planctomycetia bacterium]|nr:S41 family peptidase [Planctomycetia bacterium]